MHLSRWALLAALLAAAACRPDFRINRYPTPTSLFVASLREFERRHWDNAVTGFERVTQDISPRDTLASRAQWYLGRAHQKRDEWLLAAQAFQRVVESFPDDTLADDAGIEAARSYRKLWRKPTLDPQYGETALASYRQFLGLYPTSPLVPAAQREMNELEEWFAIKNYEVGLHYFRRKAYDSAIIYFKYVRDAYPTSAQARDAGLRLVEAYQAIRWKEDAADVCTTLRERFPGDREVRVLCGAAPAANATAPPPAADSARKPPR
jgi:outer membrane protein assembly factor BamD